jgi:hypothetical protein
MLTSFSFSYTDMFGQVPNNTCSDRTTLLLMFGYGTCVCYPEILSTCEFFIGNGIPVCSESFMGAPNCRSSSGNVPFSTGAVIGITVAGIIGIIAAFLLYRMHDSEYSCQNILPTVRIETVEMTDKNVLLKDIQRSSSQNSSSGDDPMVLTRAEFDALRTRAERDIRKSDISRESLTQELFHLQQMITVVQVNSSNCSAKDAQILQTRIAADKLKEARLLEQQTILADTDMDAYYRAMKTHFSSLMVAALGIGSGYVSVSRSTEAAAAEWVGQAIASVFPPAALGATLCCFLVQRLDNHYRKDFLKRVRVLGTTLKESEELGEEIARLFVRAHFHAQQKMSMKQADHDALRVINFSNISVVIWK